jgi:hypothetical protein
MGILGMEKLEIGPGLCLDFLDVRTFALTRIILGFEFLTQSTVTITRSASEGKPFSAPRLRFGLV